MIHHWNVEIVATCFCDITISARAWCMARKKLSAGNIYFIWVSLFKCLCFKSTFVILCSLSWWTRSCSSVLACMYCRVEIPFQFWNCRNTYRYVTQVTRSKMLIDISSASPNSKCPISRGLHGEKKNKATFRI